jgi:protein PsiE
MRELFDTLLKQDHKLHWTTVLTERAIIALIGLCTVMAVGDYVYGMWLIKSVQLADLFMLFIFAEVVAMIGAFYNTERIPVTLPIIIAITALCRLIVLHSKEMESLDLIAEAGAILILAGSAYLMSLKDKLSLEKLKIQSKKVKVDKKK